MNEMIEQVARNLQKTWNLHSSLPPIDFTAVELEALASAAVAAMRDPTTTMLSDGRDAYLRTQRHGVSGMTIDAQIRNESVRECAAYQAMIDAALASPPD